MANIREVVKSALGDKQVKNKLMKYWATFCKATGAHMDLKQEHWIELDSICDKTNYHDGTLLDALVQPKTCELYEAYQAILDESQYPTEYYEVIDMETLVQAAEQEEAYGFRQFNVISPKVCGLVKDIIDNQRMYKPIELGYIGQLGDEPENLIIVSGRHRATALVTLMAPIENWEQLQLTVKLHRFDSRDEISKYIEIENGSRTMTGEEKAVLWYGARNLNTFDMDDIFEPCKVAVSNFNRACSIFFTNELEKSDVVDVNPATAGRLGSSFSTAFRAALSAPTRKFIKDVNVAQEVAQAALTALVTNWAQLKQLSRVEHKDADGKTIISLSPARKYRLISKELASAVADAFKTQLEEKETIESAEKKAKAHVAAEKAAEKQRKELDKALVMLKKMGVKTDIDPAKLDTDKLLELSEV